MLSIGKKPDANVPNVKVTAREIEKLFRKTAGNKCSFLYKECARMGVRFIVN